MFVVVWLKLAEITHLDSGLVSCGTPALEHLGHNAEPLKHLLPIEFDNIIPTYFNTALKEFFSSVLKPAISQFLDQTNPVHRIITQRSV